ncbi:hypothetical protein BKA69DRAFT_1033616 [Paraphysoderma sedebokerense]|nr:hypothetical protein BKA69DRAFT_1033616 [Paraphysoderma sedebokerense]
MPIPRKILLEKIKNKNGVICLLTEKIDSSLLDCAGPNLKIVSTVSVGYDHIDTEECQKRGVLVTNTPDVLTDATAELTVGLTLMVMRKLGIAKDVAMRGEWKQWSLIDPLCGQSLVDKTVGIIGFGNIGYAVAKRLIGFGVSKFIYSSSSSQSRPHPPLYSPSGSVVPFERVSLENLLKLSDVAIATCSLNNSTHGLLNYSKLKLMKDSAVLVNTARGGVAVTDDLVRIVEEKRIWGIGLDVVDPEPLPPTHKLYSFPNVVILPHIGSSTIETRHAMANLAISNILKYVECGQVQTRVV